MRFTKMQAAGNDYVYMEALKEPVAHPGELSRRISDRHFGVGSDGLILICPPSDPAVADFRMRMFNADGSESEMCGNGIRCVGKYVYDNGLTRKESVRIETLAGIRLLRLHPEGGKVKTVTVDMGEPRLAPRDIPVSGEGETFVSRPLKVGGRVWQVTAVSMGNPHAIVFTEGIDRLDLPQLGPLFEHHPLFPRRTNTEFVEIVYRGHVKMRVWERGAGETLACGTGASAVAVAGALTGHTDRKVRVELLGGELDIEWDEASNHVFMTGGAAVVFTGDYPGEALSEAVAGETANGTDQ